MSNTVFQLEQPVPERLRGWLVLAAIALGLSTLAVCVVVLARTPLIGEWLQLTRYFGPALVVHVDLALGIWFCAVTMLCWAWFAPARANAISILAIYAGIGLIIWSAIASKGEVWLNDYLPAVDAPAFWLGLLLIVAAWASSAFGFLTHHGFGARLQTQSPLLWSAAIACLALLTLVSLRLFVIPELTSDAFAELVWGASHLQQIAFTLVWLFVWLLLLGSSLPPIGGQLVRWGAHCLAIPVLVVASILVLATLLGFDTHRAYTWLMEWAGSVALGVVGGLAYLLYRTKPTPAKKLFAIASLLFLVGSLLGFVIRDNSALVPAHYHGVIGGVTLAFMGLVYAMTEKLTQRPLQEASVMLQTRLYGGGLLVLILGLVIADLPRKVSGIEAESVNFIQWTGVTLMSAGGMFAVAGSLWFVGMTLRHLAGTPKIEKKLTKQVPVTE